MTNVIKKSKLSKVIAIILMIAISLSCFGVNVCAESFYQGEEIISDGILSENTFSIDGNNNFNVDTIPVTNELSTKAVSSSGFVTNFVNWEWYYTSDFTQYQYGNNCGPTMIANILSYFDTGRNVDLYSGTITQSLYNQICTDCSYTGAQGISLDTAANAIKTFVQRAGKTANINEYWLNLWSDVTRDIDADKPIIMSYNNHAYIVLGYKIEDGVKYLYVFTNWDNSPFQWIQYNQSGMDMQSVNIY